MSPSRRGCPRKSCPCPRGGHRWLPGALASLVLLLGCSEEAEPLAPAPAEEPIPGLQALSFVLDVDLVNVRAVLNSPGNPTGRSFTISSPEGPDLSIIGGEGARGEVLGGSLQIVPSGRRNRDLVALELRVRNLMKSFQFTGITQLPYPPPGVTSPVLVPWQTTIPVLGPAPSGTGSVLEYEAVADPRVVPVDTLWDGPTHDFFYGGTCPRPTRGCTLFRSLVEEGTTSDTIGGLAWSEPVRLGWEVQRGVDRFRVRLILAADLTTEYPPVPDAGGPYQGEVGRALRFDGTASFDPNGQVVRYDWTFGDGSHALDAGPVVYHAYLQEREVPFPVTLLAWDDDDIPVPSRTEAHIRPLPMDPLRLRWVDSGGGPVSQVQAGQRIRAQVCSVLDLQEARGEIFFDSGRLSLVEGRELDSSHPAVHPECSGEVDLMEDSLELDLRDTGRVTVSNRSSPGWGSGPVGVVELVFEARSPGEALLQLTGWELDPNDHRTASFLPPPVVLVLPIVPAGSSP